MALEMFLKLAGIDGGTRNYQHKGWSDMISWDWTVDRRSRPAAPDAAARSKTNEITIVKPLGAESPAILRCFAEGTALESAEISALPVLGKREAPRKYLLVALQDVRIMAIKTHGNNELDFFTEQLVLAFRKIRYETYEHAAVGPSGGAGSVENFSFDWDLAPPAAAKA